MDNVNVIRVGFIAPRFQLPDSDLQMADPVVRSNNAYSLLLFLNADEHAADTILKLTRDLPRSASGLAFAVSCIFPLKPRQVKEFKQKYKIDLRCFCDQDLRVGRLFSIVNTSIAAPSYHPMLFCIGDEGSVRFRASLEPPVNIEQLKRNLVTLV